MAAIPATQLTAQLVTSVDAASAATAASASAGEGALAFLFSDLLAQRLGVDADGLPVVSKQVVDFEDVIQDEPVPELVLDTSAPDPLVQLQQILIPPQIPVTTPVSSDEVPVETSVTSVVDSLANLPKTATPRAELVETVEVVRQVFAAETEVVAEVETVPNFPQLMSGAITEQAVRVGPQQAPAPANPPPVTGAIAQPVTSPAWGDVLGDRVMWMVGQQQQSAELRLNPPALGPLEVKLSMVDGQATLTFSTQHLPVKEALEAATPRLREMFGESGLNLGGVSVNVGTSPQQQQAQAQSQSNQRDANWNGAFGESEHEGDVAVSMTHLRGSASGMVDYFA